MLFRSTATLVGACLSDDPRAYDQAPMAETRVDAAAFNAFEAAGWEKHAAGYHDFFRPIIARFVEPLLDAANVGPGTRVLDAGCGPGYVSAPRLPSVGR